MAVDSNSILNQDWYNRLVQGIREQASGAIRATGSRADDPFWAAKQKQGIEDLNAQRQDAIRRMWEMSAGRANAYDAQEAARQRRITYGLSRNPQAGDYGAMVDTSVEGGGGELGGAGLGGYGPTTAEFSANVPPSPAVQLGGNMLLAGADGRNLKGPYTMGAGAITVRGPAGGAKFGAVPPAPDLYNPVSLARPSFDYEKEQKKLLAQNNRLAELQYQGAQEDLLQKKLKLLPGFRSEALTNAPGKTWV